jgi:hypothetical protein
MTQKMDSSTELYIFGHALVLLYVLEYKADSLVVMMS